MPLLKPRKTITVEKLIKDSQNRPIIELYKFFGWVTTPLCRNLDQPNLKSKQNCIKSHKVNLLSLIFLFFWVVHGPPQPMNEGLRHCGSLSPPKILILPHVLFIRCVSPGGFVSIKQQ